MGWLLLSEGQYQPAARLSLDVYILHHDTLPHALLLDVSQPQCWKLPVSRFLIIGYRDRQLIIIGDNEFSILIKLHFNLFIHKQDFMHFRLKIRVTFFTVRLDLERLNVLSLEEFLDIGFL